MDGWRLESQAFRCAGRLRSLHQPLAARGRTDAGTGMTASTAQPNHSLISARSINTINSHAFSMAAPRAVLSKTHHTSSTLKVRAVVASVASRSSQISTTISVVTHGHPAGGREGELNAYRARTARSTAASDAAEISCELSQVLLPRVFAETGESLRHIQECPTFGGVVQVLPVDWHRHRRCIARAWRKRADRRIGSVVSEVVDENLVLTARLCKFRRIGPRIRLRDRLADGARELETR